jgi:hypothetical protein
MLNLENISLSDLEFMKDCIEIELDLLKEDKKIKYKKKLKDRLEKINNEINYRKNGFRKHE